MIVASRQAGVRGDEAQGLLPREAPVALDVPALCEQRIVVGDQVLGPLVRRVAGAIGEPGQPGGVRRIGGVVGDEADRLVGEIAGVSMGVLSRTSSGANWSVSASMKP